jgi:Zn-dependent protease with chaperone function
MWTARHRSIRRLLFGIAKTIPMLIILYCTTMLSWLIFNRYVLFVFPVWWAVGFILALARHVSRKWALAEAVLQTKDYKLFGRRMTRFLKREKHDKATLYHLPEKSAFGSYTVMTLPSDVPDIYVGKQARTILKSDELRTIIAHELGHSWSQHYLGFELSDWIRKMLLVPCVFWAASECLTKTPIWSRNNEIIIFLATLTITWQFNLWVINLLQRPRELGADLYAVEMTKTPVSFIEALTKLAYAQRFNVFPNMFDTLGFYSHPCILKRLKRIETAYTKSNNKNHLSKEES